MPGVRRQCRPAPASCAGLQSRQFLAHARDARADQRLVSDDPEEEADQDRCGGRQPWPLCRLPDGRGRHATADVPRDFAADRGTTAAAATSASVRPRLSCVPKQSTGGVRLNARENSQINPSTIVRAVQAAGSHPRLASVLQQGGKSANIHASLGVIRAIPDEIVIIDRLVDKVAVRPLVVNVPLVFRRERLILVTYFK